MRLLTRRAALLGLSAAWSLTGLDGRISLALAAAPTQKRFVVVILRGALDGMSAVVPYGDANLAAWRPGLIPDAVGTDGGMLDLGGFYGLHPALADLHPMYASGNLLPVHAVAGHYRSRSHFEAQDYMESGADTRMDSGWLNRAVTALPASVAQNCPGGPAISLGLSMPLLLRGPASVGSWAPPGGLAPQPDLYARVAALNAQDPITGPAIAEALRERGFTDSIIANTAPQPGTAVGAQPHSDPYVALAGAAGKLLAAPNGPRIAALELGGWDTHTAQKARLKQPLQQLAAGLLALQAGLGDAWAETAVLIMTEFGRTVRQNGTNGTDHGTATVSFLAGGAVAGGRVQANWPGLSQANLFEDRDLQPTADLRSVAKGLLSQHLGLSPAAMADVFPASVDATPMRGLIRA